MIRRTNLRYLTGKQLGAAQKEPRFRVRVFHPKGRYPRAHIAQPEALFWADEDIVFCVTSSMRWRSEEGPYSEMDWLYLEELRFIGSILLCELGFETPIRFYPVNRYSPVINRRKLDLTKKSTAISLRDLVMQGIYYGYEAYPPFELKECVTQRYSFIDEDYVDLSRQPEIWEKLPTSNHLLLRGMSALLKSDMLSHYSEFSEEATVSCFIALEVSFRLILKRLVSGGVKEPNAKDAANWLYEHFDKHLGLEPSFERYFQEFYDQRVMTLHPASRFGEYPYAPLMHDDYFFLRGSLRSIFAYLITGSHDKEFLNLVNGKTRYL